MARRSNGAPCFGFKTVASARGRTSAGGPHGDPDQRPENNDTAREAPSDTSGRNTMNFTKRTMIKAMAGLVLARVVDPSTAQQIVGLITGMGI